MFVINVININEFFFDIRFNFNFIKENGLVGQVVGEFLVEDLDSVEVSIN